MESNKRRSWKKRSAATALTLGAAVFVNTALGGVVTTPLGLSAGDQYRLVFVTSTTRDALSANIADYDLFVQAATASVSALNSLGTTWKALGSTPSVDARDHTQTNPNVETGVPIFLLDGVSRIATNYADLWDGTIVSVQRIPYCLTPRLEVGAPRAEATTNRSGC